jgi:hypothetical protein
MKDKNEQIDLLLERNTIEQLETVDWDRLNVAISGSLDQARQHKTSRISRPTFLKIAVGFAAAVAIVLVAVLVRTYTTTAVRFEKGGSAVVKFVDSTGSASIQIQQTGAKSQVSIDIGGSHRDAAKCDIEIIDVNDDRQQDRNRAEWIIIRIPQPVLADNGISKDEKDLICLL